MYTINQKITLKKAMKNMYELNTNFLLVTNNNGEVIGRIRDVRMRELLSRGTSSNVEVGGVMDTDFIRLTESDLKDHKIPDELRHKVESIYNACFPVLDKKGHFKKLVKLENSHFKAVKRVEKVSRVLVIGGAGYLGSVLVRKLLKRGYKVVMFDNLSVNGSGLNLELMNKDNFNFVGGDMRKIPDLIKSIKGVDAVIHLAGIVGDPACAADPQYSLETNLFTTSLIGNICKYHEINRLIYASSCSVYGASDNMINEKSKLNPLSLYARTKINSERELLNLADENFCPTMLRMATLFGWSPRMRFDLVVNYLSALALRENKITVNGGSQWRPFLHVSDAADAYIKVLEAPVDKVRGKVYDVRNENVTIVGLGKKIKKLRNKAELIINADDVDKRNYKVSGSKIKKELGFRPKMNINRGINEIWKNMDESGLQDFRNKKYRNN